MMTPFFDRPLFKIVYAPIRDNPASNNMHQNMIDRQRTYYPVGIIVKSYATSGNNLKIAAKTSDSGILSRIDIYFMHLEVGQ